MCEPVPFQLLLFSTSSQKAKLIQHACMPAVMAHIPGMNEQVHVRPCESSVQLLIIDAMSVAQYSNDHKIASDAP